jgi:hypothetical protein
MSPEDFHHLGRVWWSTGGGIHRLAGFSKVRWTHDCRSDYRQLLRIFRTEVIEAVYGTARYAQGLAGSELDSLAVNGPGQHTRDPVQRLLISVVLMGGGGQLLPGRDRHFEDGGATIGVLAAQVVNVCCRAG